MASKVAQKRNQKQQQTLILKQRIKQLEIENEQLKAEKINPKEAIEAIFNIAEKLQQSAKAAKRQEKAYIVPDRTGDMIEIHLCRREKQVLKLVVAGKSNKEIADELKLRVSYIKGIVSKILKKSKLSDRTQLAVFAIKYGLVNLDEITI